MNVGAVIDYMTPAAQDVQRKKFTIQIKKALEETGVQDGGRVGVDVPDPVMIDALRKEGVNIVPDGNRLMMEAREIKTKYELESHKTAASIVEACFETLREELKLGVKGHELVGSMYKTAYEEGADSVFGIALCSGRDTWPNYKGVASNSIIRPRDIVFVDIILTVNGYHTCYYRTFSVGSPQQETKDAYERIYNWLYDAVKAIKPGATTKDLAEKWPDETKIWGMESADEGAASNWGHGLGL
ncbi:unnamed protein product, partial [marine sediment metagenome]